MKCYYCNNLLTNENKSIEHIIPNAIGGRLKSKELLCNTCNSILGQKYDSELCNSLSSIAGYLDIQREKGQNPTIKNVTSKSGQKYNLIKGRHPELPFPTVDLNKEKNVFHISARNEKELKNIIKSLKRKYPNLDDADLEEKFVRQKYYMNEALTMKLEIGSNNFLKAVIKIAINYFLFNSKDNKQINERVENLKNDDVVGTNIIRHYYGDESLVTKNDEEVSHIIHIQGCQNDKTLFAFVELFSSCAFIVSLNMNYLGDNISYTYTYDVLSCTQIAKTVQIDFKRKLDPADIDLNKEFIETLTKKFNRIMAIGDKRQINSIISDISKAAMQNTIGQYPEGTIITEEMVMDFAKKLSEDMAPFIAHINNKK